VRDEFTPATKELIAKRVGYLCSNPDCRCATVGAAQGHDGIVNVGVAAHITAAASRGPRFDASLSIEERRHQSNGIWLCQTHGKLVDSDSGHFTVEELRRWKLDAEKRSFEAIVAPVGARGKQAESAALDLPIQELVSRLSEQDEIESVITRMLPIAATDLAVFKRMPGWPAHAVTLNLRITEEGSGRAFHVSGLAAAIGTFNEITVIAPPGTGKTTTLLQVADAVLSNVHSVAIFVPLGEWSAQAESLLQSIVRRPAYQGVAEQHLMLLAHHGQLVLALDGWNELDSESRRRAATEIQALRREFPKLGLIVSTRRQALDVPISGPVVEIDFLSEEQQLEIARTLRGTQGEALLDHAWRTPGVRELISIPLYLTALLAHVPGATMPTTKEEVLRLFVTEHERVAAKAAALREALFGFHPRMLTALAVEATRSANTAISDTRARAVVRQVEDDLSAAGQITTAPQPSAVLDVLVSHHTLVRSGAEGAALSFQHQQFQEWYASFEVEQVMRAAVAGDETAHRRLRVDILNLPPWEEAILFASERLSRTGRAGAETVAATVLLALPIDPMLAAEMIFRSSPEVWKQIRDKMSAFAARWHTPGKVDRAVRFMITSGRAEFADFIWPLIANPDTQVHLSALRAARRFRPSVLGADVVARTAAIPEVTRKNVLSEIAMRGDINGIALATELAKTDTSANVQLAVIEALQFRRANRHVTELLGAAADGVWPLLAARGYIDEIADVAAAHRLRRERQRQIAAEGNPLRRLSLLLESEGSTAADAEKITAIIEAADFPVRDQHAAWSLNQAFKRYAEAVETALLHRLAAGRELPFDADEMLASAAAVDDGPIAAAAVAPDPSRRIGTAAAMVVGPNTTGTMIDTAIALSEEMNSSRTNATQAARDRFYELLHRISVTRPSAFGQAVLDRASTGSLPRIRMLADLVARHGDDEDRQEPLLLDGELLRGLIASVHRWVDGLLESTDGTRAQFADIARAIGRLGRPELLTDLKRLLDEDLARWRLSRAARAARVRGSAVNMSDAAHSYVLQYRQAFAAIGGEDVARLIADYLGDIDFGFDAACVFKAVWDRGRNVPKPSPFKSWPDFSEVAARRGERRTEAAVPSASPYAETIFSAIGRLIQPGSDASAQLLAIKLGRIALSMPYGDKAAAIRALLALPQPVRSKRELLAALVLAGEIISANMVLEGIRAFFDAAQQNGWMLNEGWWEVEGWLELLPFSDRPSAIHDGIAMVNAAMPHPDMERVVAALSHAPGAEAERALGELARRSPQLVSLHEWVGAFLRRGTVSSARMLIDLVCDATLGSGRHAADVRSISQQLASFIRAHPELQAELPQRYESLPSESGRELLEQVLSEVGNADYVMALVRGYARSRRAFDGQLHRALHDAALDQRPASGWIGAYDLHPVPLTSLRRELFGMLEGTQHEATLAAASLSAIDELRDEYGPAQAEPRHPDVETGRPWPLAASGADS
jgi:hypothetical protein